MAKERTWIVPPTIDVQFTEEGRQIPGTGRVNPEAFAQAMIDAAATLLTVGGTLDIAPARVEQPGPLRGVYHTHAVVFTWESFVPAVEIPDPPQGEEGPPEPAAPETPTEAEPDPERMSVAEPQPVEA